jgi:hypothetical protein
MAPQLQETGLMSIVAAKKIHEEAYQDVCVWLKKYEHLPPRELLALMANLLGKMIALQDQRTMTPEQAMEIVATNMQHGNQQVVDELMASKGSA